MADKLKHGVAVPAAPSVVVSDFPKLEARQVSALSRLDDLERQFREFSRGIHQVKRELKLLRKGLATKKDR